MVDVQDMRCGFVALIGAPNAGKSTLLNALVGMKIAIVTHKVQTTRTQLRGIAIHENSQLIFVDTPGIFKPKRRLDRAMVSAAWQGADDAEIIALLVDARKGLSEDVERIIEGLEESGKKAILILNKIDLIKRDSLLALSTKCNEYDVFTETFMISALNSDGVTDLKSHLASAAQKGPWMYPEDDLSDVTMRVLAAEVTREKIYLRLHDEIPYAITVETEKWKELKDGSVRIEQVVHVTRDSHKQIVIGKGGSMLKKLGSMAREELEETMGRRVHLFLHVRVTEKWQDDKTMYQDMGLDWVE
ncbi:GTPase Era [Temperatibacter marinus]|uniref:GTPase Era n=1 Tax=Temperatibacter marinus TaxID=1456591 RepID=A0AA52EAY3_9PROT|nr:GTPase Era [Temperatibacter marinus]WND01982.1 GTPase Era [Temperatibacter marinus]